MNVDYEIFENLNESISEIPPDSIISKTIYKSENHKVILFGFSPGQELSDHTSSANAIIHIVRGKGVIKVAGDTISAVEGTWIHMKPEIPHSVNALSDLYMLLYLFPA
jgi:quercetin dioxygenase-like cupin family protein